MRIHMKEITLTMPEIQILYRCPLEIPKEGYDIERMINSLKTLCALQGVFSFKGTMQNQKSVL